MCVYLGIYTHPRTGDKRERVCTPKGRECSVSVRVCTHPMTGEFRERESACVFTHPRAGSSKRACVHMCTCVCVYTHPRRGEFRERVCVCTPKSREFRERRG